MRYIFLLFTIFSLTACIDSDEKRLQSALKFAGENRSELEKVLAYYQDDNEKYQAARFLIENMPRWYGYEGWALDSIHTIIAKAYKDDYLPPNVYREWSSFPFYSFDKVYDAHIITADYLITNIDLAFEVWKKYPWNQYLDFDNFCELILPYRLGDEPLSNWRPLYHNKYMNLLDSLYQGNDVVEAANILAEKLKEERFRWISGFNMPRSGGVFLFDSRMGYCREECDITLYTLRACGIPTAFDFFIYSPEYQKGHTWNVIRDTTGQYLPLYFTSFFASRDKADDGRKKGKVYRECFALQPEIIPGINKEKNISALFRNRHMQDVSSNYFGNNEIVIPVPVSKEKYLYLGVFSPQGWIPIDIAKIEGGKATFSNVEPDIVYQPLYSDGVNHRIATYPFLYTKEGIHWFKPEEENSSSVHITRKMPLMKSFRQYMTDEVNGSKIEGSNDPLFRTSELLYHIREGFTHPRNILTTLTNKPFRYIRYTSPAGQILQLSNISFYKDPELQQPVSVKIVHEDPIERIKQSTCLDGNILTYYYSKYYPHIVFDAGEQVEISKILFYPRNDDNFIAAGNRYELFYQNGVKCWSSLGVREAQDDFLEWEIPANSLLWLRNRTKGKEEQIFFEREGKQIFVYDLRD